jgi:hypothetical protein
MCLHVSVYIFIFLCLSLSFKFMSAHLYFFHTFTDLYIRTSIHIIQPPNHTSVFLDMFKVKFISQSIHLSACLSTRSFDLTLSVCNKKRSELPFLLAMFSILSYICSWETESFFHNGIYSEFETLHIITQAEGENVRNNLFCMSSSIQTCCGMSILAETTTSLWQ